MSRFFLQVSRSVLNLQASSTRLLNPGCLGPFSRKKSNTQHHVSSHFSAQTQLSTSSAYFSTTHYRGLSIGFSAGFPQHCIAIHSQQSGRGVVLSFLSYLACPSVLSAAVAFRRSEQNTPQRSLHCSFKVAICNHYRLSRDVKHAEKKKKSPGVFLTELSTMESERHQDTWKWFQQASRGSLNLPGPLDADNKHVFQNRILSRTIKSGKNNLMNPIHPFKEH